MSDLIEPTVITTETPDKGPGFAELGVQESLARTLVSLGFTQPTAIQARVIPALLNGRDVLGQAQTGTGKTAAYGLPLLQRLNATSRAIQALVLVPTRELAMQVTAALLELSRDIGNPGILAVYGGNSMGQQLRVLQQGVRVLVATPGRLLDHLDRGSINLSAVQMVVLDEADEMLKMGFLDEVKTILDHAPPERQTALLSATLPGEVARIAEKYLRNPDRIKDLTQAKTVATVEQRYAVCNPQDRAEAVARMLEVEPFESALVFSRTKMGCDELTDALQRRGVPCEALHGDLAQAAREAVLRRLRDGRLRVVVATDVAARGLDVPTLDLVVTVELPGHLETYVHRIGRTGRAGRTGTSILVLGPRDERKLVELERFIGQRLKHQRVPTAAEVDAAKLDRFVSDVVARAEETELAAWHGVIERCVSKGATLPQLAAALCRMAAPRGLQPLPVTEIFHQPEPIDPLDKRGEKKPRASSSRIAMAQPASVAPLSPSPTTKPAPAKPAAVPSQVTAIARDWPIAPAQEPIPREPSAVQPASPAKPASRQDNSQQRSMHPSVTLVSLGVGRRNGVTPAMIVACLTREGNVPPKALGRIEIDENHSTVEMPADLGAALPDLLRGVQICGRYLNPRSAEETGRPQRSRLPPSNKPRPGQGNSPPMQRATPFPAGKGKPKKS